jgi:glycosyltransferase XagB
LDVPSLIIFFYLIISLSFFSFSSINLLYLASGLFRRKNLVIQNVTQDIYKLENFKYPVVTILLPVYREEVTLPFLLKSISELNYPKDKLDIHLLIEPDDEFTIKAILSIPYNNIPNGRIEFVDTKPIKIHIWNNTVVKIKYIYLDPKNSRSKPKSLNRGLSSSVGKYLIVYDAEDRPQADQLLRLTVYMENHPEIVCLQARLGYYNTGQSLLTKVFAIEYLNHFTVLLPLIHHKGLVVLLGGTSNFFRTDVLINLKGWDEKNVTEDADLGIRIARRKGKTLPFNTTTWEEAPPKLYPWLRQRVRWNKGFIYTYKVHFKKPLSLIRDVGLKSTFFLLYQLIGPVINMIALPGWIIFIIALINFLGIPVHPISDWITTAYSISPYLFYAGVITFVIGIGFVEIVTFFSLRINNYAKRKYRLLVLMPIYNILLGVAGLVATIEFLVKPQVWHKTYHGFSMEKSKEAIE